jgi:ubiquinone/menaquinone biosynthesis C-methylase UbiE
VSDSARRARWRRYWDEHSKTYDREMRFMDRTLFGDTRSWICRQARGEVLEVAIGTGLNLEHYPPDVALTGIELSPDMLAIARRRADDLDRRVELRVGDAEALDVPSTTFDTVVCTFSLCAIPDHRKAPGRDGSGAATRRSAAARRPRSQFGPRAASRPARPRVGDGPAGR